jgi:hypothetical protein
MSSTLLYIVLGAFGALAVGGGAYKFKKRRSKKRNKSKIKSCICRTTDGKFIKKTRGRDGKFRYRKWKDSDDLN